MCDIHTYGQFVGYLFETRHMMSPWLQTRNIDDQSNINRIAAACKIGGYLSSGQESCMYIVLPIVDSAAVTKPQFGRLA